MIMELPPSYQDIKEAARRIRPHIHRTPTLTCGALDSLAGAELFFKCENLQKVGAFKARGALNTVLSLEDCSSGLATHSSGNHAAALAYAARVRNAPAFVVMPENAPRVKVDAVRSYGADITFCAPTLEARERTLEALVERTGAVFVHPYDDYSIIAGQATAALELLEDVPDLDLVLAPVGGGGLLSGTALAVRYVSPKTRVIAAEPEGADDALRSLRSGEIVPSVNPKTIADGLLTSLSERTFSVIREFVSDIATVSDEEIVAAMRRIWERMKIVVEPSSAVPLAAALSKALDVSNLRVGIILSGGNVDLERLPF